MATDVDICNLALARLGDEATITSIDPPDQSAQATHCARFYPIARGIMLDSHYWGFCLTRGYANLMAAAPLSGWQYAYAFPNGAVNIVALYLDGSVDDQNPQDFEIEALSDGTEVIYTNVVNPVVRYTLNVTNPAKFQPLFVEAFAWLLASYLAGPVLKGEMGIKMAQACYGAFKTTLKEAQGSDAAQRRVTVMHRPDHMTVRGIPVQSQDDLGGWAR